MREEEEEEEQGRCFNFVTFHDDGVDFLLLTSLNGRGCIVATSMMEWARAEHESLTSSHLWRFLFFFF